MDENEISPVEEEGKILLESRILLELPDVETLWRFHPIRREHSCCFTRGTKSRTIFFSRDTLKTMVVNPERVEETVKETIAELRRRV
jgi:hypothetical protein